MISLFIDILHSFYQMIYSCKNAEEYGSQGKVWMGPEAGIEFDTNPGTESDHNGKIYSDRRESLPIILPRLLHFHLFRL